MSLDEFMSEVLLTATISCSNVSKLDHLKNGLETHPEARGNGAALPPSRPVCAVVGLVPYVLNGWVTNLVKAFLLGSGSGGAGGI